MFRIGVIVCLRGSSPRQRQMIEDLGDDRLVVTGVRRAPEDSNYPMLLDVARISGNEYRPRAGSQVDRERATPFLEAVSGADFWPHELQRYQVDRQQQVRREIVKLAAAEGSLDAPSVHVSMEVDPIAWLLTDMVHDGTLERIEEPTDRFDGTEFFSYQLA